MAEKLGILKQVAICTEFRHENAGSRGTSKVNLANWNTSSIFVNMWTDPAAATPSTNVAALHNNDGQTKGLIGRTAQTLTALEQELSTPISSLYADLLTKLAPVLIGNTAATGTYGDGSTAVGAGVAVPYQADSEPFIVDIVWDDGVDWYTAGVACSGFTISGSHNTNVTLTPTFKLFEEPVLLTSLGGALKTNWAPDPATTNGIMGFNRVSSGTFGSSSTLWAASVTFNNGIVGRWDAGRGTDIYVDYLLYNGERTCEFSFSTSVEEDEKAKIATEVACDAIFGATTFSATKALVADTPGADQEGQSAWEVTLQTRIDTTASDSELLIITDAGL